MTQLLSFLLVVFGHPLSLLTGFLARLRGPAFLVQAAIRFYFVKRVKVNVAEIEHPIEHYRSALDFFTRRLAPGMRPIATESNYIVSPADGKISSFGKIVNGKIHQVKNRTYRLNELVGEEKARIFENGDSYTVYLSPRDYHRVHHAFGGKLEEALYFPGRLFPVNEFSLRNFDGVFSRNKRIALFYKTKTFSYSMIFVGALNVGSIRLSFDPRFWTTAQKTTGGLRQKRYSHLFPAKGDEAGAFELGSTIILLFPKNTVHFFPKEAGDAVRMGRPIARLR
ncbi:MAG: phosphatidylserine decarboxylase [Spirochaetia bacterium]|nr:phosphatidylserine decarboxylase [Spirochaetia bacterium]